MKIIHLHGMQVLRQSWRCGILQSMQDFPDPITPETENVLQQRGGPLQIVGSQGEYVVMRLDVYDAMLGISDDEEAQTLASVRRGLADVDAGRTHDADEAFDKLTVRHSARRPISPAEIEGIE